MKILLYLITLTIISVQCQKKLDGLTIVPPTVNTISATTITSTGATSGGDVVYDGEASVTQRGICWGTAKDPEYAGTRSTNGRGLGSFTHAIKGLSPGTTYYVRAYAINSAGIAYGQSVSFTTTF